MNTDASTVEDINIHQIIERLSMSCIESSGERFSISRNRSFTLFRNERDFKERPDSVHINIDDQLIRYGSLRTCSRHFTRFPHLKRPLVVIVPF